ncbi:DUF5916 domain-containing protein [candidate division KSB1 bacterium]
MKKLLFIFTGILSLFIVRDIFAQEVVEKKIYNANRINPHPPVIDGKFLDECWEKASWGSEFVQRIPYENEAPSQQTSFKIMYDDENLYIAIRAYDTEPEKIESRLSRRDQHAGDWVEVMIDSYYDKRTAFVFNVSSSGVRMDALFSNDGGNVDFNWNAVWDAKTEIDVEGWKAELEIPLTQLRFGNKDEHIWGLQVRRMLFREGELSTWQYIPTSVSGMVSRFGEVHSISNIKPRRQVEILPYSVGKVERFEQVPGNPFATGKLNNINGGIDGKLGITNNLIMDFTLNPDFGQVEADPSVVNLSAFETFFQEKRPFFIEGSNIFNFRVTNTGTASQDKLFYSRRIGRSPQYYPDLESGESADIPDNSSILGAFKLTGKTDNGFSIGILESIASQEKAEVDLGGSRRKETVEPGTNYFVTRMQKDFDKGNTVLGGMFTAVNRNIDNSTLNFLHRSAYTGGLDLSQYWKDKKYFFTLRTIFSNVRGDEEALLRSQESYPRYFQRSDADHVEVDPLRTSLSGHGGDIEIGKSGGKVNYGANFVWRSPGLELNDIGYQMCADYMVARIYGRYNIFEPFSVFRNIHMEGAQWANFNFSGERSGLGGFFMINGQLKNFWHIFINGQREQESISLTNLRGGPSIKQSGDWNIGGNISTDSRKKLSFMFRTFNRWSDNDEFKNRMIGIGATYRPSNAFEFTAIPDFGYNDQRLQYVGTRSFNGENRYILSTIDHKTVGVTLRLNYSITPDLTVQYYGQPFISAGKYSDFKKITDPRADRFQDRFHVFSDDEIMFDSVEDVYNIDENSDGEYDYQISDPDFNFRQFRSNLIIRWEYTPGSTVYLVWSQQRTGYSGSGEFTYRDDMRDLFEIHPHNIFLIKFNKWFSF